MSRDGSSTSWSRRGLLGRGLAGLGLAAGLGACGFEPMHARREGTPGVGFSGPIANEMAAVRVALIPDRNGQLLRRELQQRIEGPVAARYDLRIALSLTQEGVAIRRDGSSTRVRTIAVARWILQTQGEAPDVVAQGTERVMDAFNIPDNQFFAADSSREAMNHRVVQALADEVVRSLAVQMRRRAEMAAAG